MSAVPGARGVRSASATATRDPASAAVASLPLATLADFLCEDIECLSRASNLFRVIVLTAHPFCHNLCAPHSTYHPQQPNLPAQRYHCRVRLSLWHIWPKQPAVIYQQDSSVVADLILGKALPGIL